MDVNVKKIAVLCNYELLPERVGGMDYFFWSFDQKCKENNFQIDWFFPNKSTHGDYSKLTIIDTNYLNTEIFFVQYCQTNVQNYTYIFTHFVELCTSTFKKINATSNAKIIVVDHNPRPLNGYSSKKKIVKRIKGILYSKYIDTFIAVSNVSLNQLIMEFGNQIKVKSLIISNGLEVSKLQKRKDSGFKSRFIVASHLRKDKGIQDLIHAVKEVSNETSLQFAIDIYGTGYYEDFLKNLCKLHKVNSYFNFMGSVSNLNELYQNYDYLIHPSHGETFCFSVVEALFCRLPVITTKNQGNVLGLVKENINGFLFDEGNSNQLKQIVIKVVSSQYQIDNSIHYNNKIDELTLERMVANYYNLLQ